MTSPCKFQLHTLSNLNYPRIDKDVITYGPLNVLKLEAGKTLAVQTGTQVAQCNKDGKVVILPSKEYAEQLKFTDNEIRPNDGQKITIKVSNVTKQFIRIEPEDFLFEYHFKPNDQPSVLPSEEDTEEEPVVSEPVVSEPVVSEPVVSEQVAEQVVAPVVAPVVSEPVAEPVVAPVVAEPKAQPKAQKATKKKVQKKKRVSI